MKRRLGILSIAVLAGLAAAMKLAEMGIDVDLMSLTPVKRSHSVCAQGGINAAKNYPGDGDSIYRLFFDTIKGGDYRSREANVYRLAQTSNAIIDQNIATSSFVLHVLNFIDKFAVFHKRFDMAFEMALDKRLTDKDLACQLRVDGAEMDCTTCDDDQSK